MRPPISRCRARRTRASLAPVRAIALAALVALAAGTATAGGTAPPAPVTAGEALQALKALETATGGQLSYDDYARRVGGTRVDVDHYLNGNAAEAAATPIREALAFFVFAARAWSAKAGPQRIANYPNVARDPVGQRCPKLAEAIASATAV